MIELLRCTNKEEWDDFVLDNGGHPLQLWSWGQVKSGHGWVAERILAYQGEKIIGGAQVLVRKLPLPFRSFSYIPRGPIFSKGTSDQIETRTELLNAIAALIKRDYRSVALSVEPDSNDFQIGSGWIGSESHVLPAETILLDLHKSESELLANMAKKTRQYIRKSSADVEIKRAKTQADINICLDLYVKTATRAGFNLHSRQYYTDVFLQMADYSPVFIAYDGEAPVAFLWLAISEATSYELYGGVNERGQALRANYALKWYAIKKTREWGLSFYDFGGLVAGGVANFKQGWSSEINTFSGTFDKPLSPFYTLWIKGLPMAKKASQKLRKIGR